MYILDNASRQVRVHIKDGNTLYLASDIGKILGPKLVRETHPDDKIAISNGEDEETFLTKAGVYRAAMGSSKPIVGVFKAFMTDVVSTIDEIGRYSPTEAHGIKEAKKGKTNL